MQVIFDQHRLWESSRLNRVDFVLVFEADVNTFVISLLYLVQLE